MSKLQHEEFTEAPADYLVCRDSDRRSDVSCVIVEDDPGPYLEFVQDVVQTGSAKLAMTAPFTDQTLQLLQGREVVFGSGDHTAKVRLPNSAHCVLILDMRNGSNKSTQQHFKGYDPKTFELAGYQFYKQLRGFPGKIFFATRYGKGQLPKDIEGAGGVVQLELKSDYHGPMPETDKQNLLSALSSALVQVDVSKAYRMSRRGDVIDILCDGDVGCILPGKDGPNKAALAFMEVVQTGPTGISDEELARRIHYKPRVKASKSGGKEDDEVTVPSASQTSGDLLARILPIVKDGQIKGLDYATICKRLGFDPASVGDAGALEVLREITELMKETNEDFSADDLLCLLQRKDTPTGEAQLDLYEREGMSVWGDKGPPETVTRAEKARCLKSYVELHYKEIPSRQAEIEDLKAELSKRRAEGLRGIAASAKANNKTDAIHRKKSMGSIGAELQQKIDRLQAEVAQLGKIRDEYYRVGVKSEPIKDGKRTVGYRAAAPVSKIADAMRQLPKRLVEALQEQCHPVPVALMDHVQKFWVRKGGVHYYTGQEVWQV